MSEPRYFSLDYVEQVVLRNGTRVRLRLLRPDDKAALRAGFERLSAESRYTRFLGPKASLSDDELRYLCEIDHEDHFAIGAMLDDDAADGVPVGLAIGRFVRLPDNPRVAEAAIAVVDEVQNQGLGKLVFLRLSAAAAERGVDRLRCEVLATNAGMTALLAQIAPERSVELGTGVLTIEIPVERIEPTQEVAAVPPHSPLYRLLRAAAANAVEWTEGVRRLWRT